MTDVRLHLGFEDSDLLDRTIVEYQHRIEAGEISEEEAVADAEALALGMLKIDCGE